MNYNTNIAGSTYKDIGSFEELFSNPDFRKALKDFNLYLIREDPEYRQKVKNYIDECNIISEFKPIKRIATIETVLGLNDMVDHEDDGRELTIPEKIETLRAEIKHIEIKASGKPVVIKEPKTKTEHRATLLVKALEDSGKNFFSANEIIDFLKCKLPESCCINDKIKNVRKVKQDVINTARSMFPNIELNKKKTGHREVRLILLS